MPTHTGNIQSILVRGTNWLGDAVMTTPALQRLRASFPQAQIALLATPRTAELFSAAPFVDEVLVYRRHEEGTKAFFSTVEELRQRRFDLALLFQNAFEAALLSLLGRVPLRIGYAMQGRRLMLTHPLHHTPDHRHRHQMHDYLDIVAVAEGICGIHYPDAQNESLRPSLIASEVHHQAAASLLHRFGIEQSRQPSAVSRQPEKATPRRGDPVNSKQVTRNSKIQPNTDYRLLTTDRPLIAFNTSATNSRAKCWPEDRFAAVADALMDTMQAHIIFIGAISERDNAESVIRRMKKSGALNLAGKTTMRELIGLLRVCSLLISNDTGPAHVSAALGRPTLTIFGPTNEFETAPLGIHAEIIRAENIECARCMHRDCPIDHRCMTHISVDEVVRCAKKIMTSF
jgi:heptosyltransferase-2